MTNYIQLVLPAAILMLSIAAAFPLKAECKGTFAQNHPRRAEVNHRDANLNNKLSSDYGNLSGHYFGLERQDQSIRNQGLREARANGGYLTKSQQSALNQRENHLNQEVSADQGAPSGQFGQNHPRRSQVLNGDAQLNQQLSQNYGNLGGHYAGLQRQDSSIARQEQRDARRNGGFITTGQQTRLDNEESHVQNEINSDTGQ